MMTLNKLLKDLTSIVRQFSGTESEQRKGFRDGVEADELPIICQETECSQE